jgi:hypothetical protein
MNDLAEQKEIQFNVSTGQSLRIDLPDTLEETHRFDDIDVLFSDQEKAFSLFENEHISEAVRSLNNALNLALEGKIKFPADLNPDKGIYYYSMISMNDFYKNNNTGSVDPASKVAWIWSGTKNNQPQTFIYTIDADIFLEISPNYKWLNAEPQEGDGFIPFEEFLKSYRMLYRFKLDTPTILEWQKTCENVLNSLIQ